MSSIGPSDLLVGAIGLLILGGVIYVAVRLAVRSGKK